MADPGTPSIVVDAARLAAEMDHLASFTQCTQTGRTGERAVTRVVFSDDDLRARAWMASLFIEAGLTVRGRGRQHISPPGRHGSDARSHRYRIAHRCHSTCGHV